MRLYLLRHGESEGNAGLVAQGPTSSLTEKGIRQAEFAAKRFQSIPIDEILSSPQKRAKHTAEIVGKALNKPVEYSDLLIERKRASVTIGKAWDDPELRKVGDLIDANFHVPGWKHSDEENFEDLKSRALKLLDHAKGLGKENLLLITHGVFMRMVVAVAIMGEKLTSYEYWNFLISLVTENTGITILEYKNSKFDKENLKWRLIAWNDHSHLNYENS